MKKDSARSRWSVDQRLEFIDFRIFWEGAIRRADLVDKFGVSVPQASLDLAKYRESAPSNIEYDASRKSYIAGKNFKPIFFKPNPARYLAQLQAIGENVISVDDTLMSSSIPCDTLPVPSRDIISDQLRKLIQAIRQRRSVLIEYQSMNKNRPRPVWREISPHALGSDGLRWHVRAFCHIDNRFKDFIISRCIQVGEDGEAKATGEMDAQWNSSFEVVLAPNPQFSELQSKIIELDYGMQDGRCSLMVRHALLYYFDKRMRLDIPEDPAMPQKTPIVVQNRDDYDQLLRSLSF